MFRVLWDLEKLMEWSGDRMVWNGRDLDSPDPFGLPRVCYLNHLFKKTSGLVQITGLNEKIDLL